MRWREGGREEEGGGGAGGSGGGRGAKACFSCHGSEKEKRKDKRERKGRTRKKKGRARRGVPSLGLPLFLLTFLCPPSLTSFPCSSLPPPFVCLRHLPPRCQARVRGREQGVPRLAKRKEGREKQRLLCAHSVCGQGGAVPSVCFLFFPLYFCLPPSSSTTSHLAHSAGARSRGARWPSCCPSSRSAAAA